MSSELHNIRPAGRHIFAIGRDLIQSPFAAVIELVKNAYDADADVVIIEFSADVESNKFEVKISDNGHGMTKED